MLDGPAALTMVETHFDFAADDLSEEDMDEFFDEIQEIMEEAGVME